jgi:hypothetical protein
VFTIYVVCVIIKERKTREMKADEHSRESVEES